MIRWTGEAAPGTPFWWAEGAPISFGPDAPPPKVDILVIGAGYTGLAAAIAASDAGASVAVIDAGQPGQAASTRNGGMFGAHPRLSWDVLAKSVGEAAADGIFGEATSARESIEALMAREGIDCDRQTTGRIQLAWTRDHFEEQKRTAARVRDKSDVQVSVVERDELPQEIGTEKYFGAILFPEHGGIQPKKFHDGLVASAARRGVPVIAMCPATGWMRTRSGFIVETPRGDVRAEKIVLATNGYTPRQFMWHRRRVFPVPSFLIATEELPEDLIASIAPGRRMMVETRARHSYFRLSPDGKRILWGGRAAIRPLALSKAANRLYATMTEVWPVLNGVRLSHVWTGFTGYSFSHTPQVGEDRGLHFAMGYSGSGTVMAPYLGMKAGLRAAGATGGETGYSKMTLPTSLLNPTGTPWFLYAADAWYQNVVDVRENWAARR